MREFSEENLTGAVVERLANTPDPRLKLLVTSLVRHLHACVREVEPTFDEWMAAINFLTRTGQTCTDKRQEFILLSDTLGISMLVDAINHRNREGVTEPAGNAAWLQCHGRLEGRSALRRRHGVRARRGPSGECDRGHLAIGCRRLL